MTDDAPYGGGGGMVMKVEPIERTLAQIPRAAPETPVILLTPQGERFCQKTAEELAKHPQLVLICGHYEGVDERVRLHLANRELSIGDYVLTGGELSALVVVDAVSRLVPGVLGNSDSAGEDSFSMGALEYPHYTRPAEYKGWGVPEVLLSGNHREIDAWRRRESLLRTRYRRPDLLAGRSLTDEEKGWLNEEDNR
jgi:tRNA (guanine37-N1)-methyltransferase